MKKKHKQLAMKITCGTVLVVFTAISLLPAATTIMSSNDSNSGGIVITEDNVEEMFGEGAVYDPETGTVSFPDREGAVETKTDEKNEDAKENNTEE